jgi:hypothetical protein
MSPEKSERMPLANEALHTNDVMSNVRVDVNDADPLNTLRDVRDFVADPDGAAKAVRPADRGPPTAIALTADRVVCDMHSRCGAVRSRTRGNAVPATPSDRVARMYLAMASILSERQVRGRALDRNRMVTLGSTSFTGVPGNGLANFKDSAAGFVVRQSDARSENPRAATARPITYRPIAGAAVQRSCETILAYARSKWRTGHATVHVAPVHRHRQIARRQRARGSR